MALIICRWRHRLNQSGNYSSGEVAAGSVTVRFTGSTALLFDDGETSWMTDGWFSRPTFIEIITERLEPDLAAIGRGLKANDVDKLDAVIPSILIMIMRWMLPRSLVEPAFTLWLRINR